MFRKGLVMTCLRKRRSRRCKAVAKQPVTQARFVFNTLREDCKLLKKEGLFGDASGLESILLRDVIKSLKRLGLNTYLSGLESILLKEIIKSLKKLGLTHSVSGLESIL